MSTVSGSGGASNSSGQDEVVKRNREDYAAKESEMVKKHQREIRRLTEQHFGEVEKIKEAHESQLKELQASSHETITSRDHKYQQEMENMRGLHRKQIQDVANNATRTVDITKKTTDEELRQSLKRNEERVHDINEDYRRGLAQKDEDFQNNIKNMREKQQATVTRYRERMNEKHGNEIKTINDGHQDEVSDIQKEARDYRKATEAQRRDQELRHFQSRRKDSEDFLDTVRSERKNRSQTEQVLRDGFKEGIQKTRERFEAHAAKEREATEVARDHLKNDVSDRVNNEMRVVERENNALRGDAARDMVTRKREVDKQVANVRDAYQKNVDNYKMQKEETVRTFNERNAKDIDKVNKENSKQMVDMNRDYLEQSDMKDTRHAAEFETLTGEYESRTTQQKAQTDMRVKNIRKESDEVIEKLAGNHEEGRKGIQQGYRNELHEMKLVQEKETRSSVERMKEQIRKQALQNAEKTDIMVDKYEKQITALKDEVVKAKKEGADEVKRITNEMTRQHQAQMDGQASQFQDKIRQTQDQHTNEMRQATKHSQERMDQLLSVVKAKS